MQTSLERRVPRGVSVLIVFCSLQLIDTLFLKAYYYYYYIIIIIIIIIISLL